MAKSKEFNKKYRLSPTMTSKIHAHVREMKFVQTVTSHLKNDYRDRYV